jgi:3-dehydroquinate synthase
MNNMHSDVSEASLPPTTTLTVPLGPRAYDIHIGAGLIAAAGRLIAPLLKRPRTAVVTDEGTAPHHLDRLTRGLDAAGIHAASIILPAGESVKSFAQLESLCDWLVRSEIERGDTIIALGGGVIGDITGLAAALLHRGIGFIQIPTTLLAQVDSSIGGKTAINLSSGKNLAGAFHQPSLVLCDTQALDTLPPRELRAGYAEIVKYAVIGDTDFFAWLEANGAAVLGGDHDARMHAIELSCRMKAAVVAADEREQSTSQDGGRARLNFGHTFGHAIEAVAGYGDAIRHGEAVAIGMVMALDLSERLGHTAPGEAARVAAHLRANGLPATLNDMAGLKLSADDLLAAMTHDKKADGGRVVFVLARGIGKVFLARDVEPGAVRETLLRGGAH